MLSTHWCQCGLSGCPCSWHDDVSLWCEQVLITWLDVKTIRISPPDVPILVRTGPKLDAANSRGHSPNCHGQKQIGPPEALPSEEIPHDTYCPSVPSTRSVPEKILQNYERWKTKIAQPTIPPPQVGCCTLNPIPNNGVMHSVVRTA